MPNHSKNGIHAQRLKDIRKYVDFDYNLNNQLTKYQKAKIKKYHDEIQALTQRPYQVYRPKSKSRLKTAQEFAQHEKQLKGLKVAFIPTDGESHLRIRFDKKGELIAHSKYVNTRFIKLDERELIKDTIKHVNNVIKKSPAQSFTVLAGRFEISGGYDKNSIAGRVAELTSKYTQEKGNHYFGNWLIGISGHSFTNQEDFGKYLKAKDTNKEKTKRDRRNAKRRAANKKAKKKK